MAPPTSHAALALALALTAGCAAGTAQQVSDSGAGAFEAALTATADGFAVAWYDVRDGNGEIYARLLSADGSPAGPEHRLTNDPAESYEADIQAIGEQLAVAWYDKTADGHLTARLGVWSRDGQPLWSHAISAAERSGRNPALAVRGTQLFVAWIEDSGTDQSDVWAGWWDVEGRPLGEPHLVGPAGRTTWNLNVDLGADDSGWIAFDAKAGTQSEELFLARVQPQADVVSGFSRTIHLERLTDDDGRPSKYPDIALRDDAIAIAWHDMRDGNEEVYLAIAPQDRVTLNGRRITNTPGSSIGSYLAWSGDTLGLAWCDDSDGAQHEIYFQPFGRDGSPQAPPRRLTDNDTASLVPSIRAARGAFALAWNEYAAPADDGHGSTGRSEIAFTVVR